MVSDFLRVIVSLEKDKREIIIYPFLDGKAGLMSGCAEIVQRNLTLFKINDSWLLIQTIQPKSIDNIHM